MRTYVCLLLFIFFSQPAFCEKVSTSTTRIIFVGDVLFVNVSSDPFKYISEKIKSADISMCNLESPLSKSGVKSDKKYVFAGTTSCVKTLECAGFSIVNLANNHILDYGDKAFLETLDLLEKNKIKYVGAGRDIGYARLPVIIEKNGIKIAFWGYSNTIPKSFYAKKDKPGTSPAYESFIKEDVKLAKKSSDILVVSFHWGKELETNPHKQQVKLAHLAIKYGADIVIGHHPHVLQKIELYQGKMICYSLGNFLFKSKNKKSCESIIMECDIEDRKIKKYVFYPVIIEEGIPKMKKNKVAEKILSGLREISNIGEISGNSLIVKN